MSSSRLLMVPDGLAGERVDVGISRMLGLSRTRAADLVTAGHVLVDGRAPARSTRLEPGVMVHVELPDEKPAVEVRPQIAEGMSLIHQDDDIVVIDKPVGVAAHPSAGWSGPTVLGHLAAAGVEIRTSGDPERQGIVSRLDVGTSGLMVVARTERAYTTLKDAFRAREVGKVYHAICQGTPDQPRGTIEAPIGRSPQHDYKFAVREDGKHSVTHYETLEELQGATLLRIGLETGRTHQIRVHMSALHHPLVGDPLYGADPTLAERVGLIRQWLHAMELTFVHPATGREVTYTSQYPSDLAQALEALRGR
ncbi:ribosomal large subunit pseudouridine synthase D [Brachybacterium faecium DSM 4810]|uniref:Pseudouridine synthase n=1 Tax=Brachybacterium faecium (strain ATCC 43885 / DSM 4810 / JCM 11609 / LMG 19847 / NBRC 14762 / NCIMB 9860 / 6-10) TaxID=446465 RepID=C7MBG5_BRAFD|nr:RluA family pseudouridine synthase [Brachybacterium faecium]ACU84938.1 ribosomal large subunit pseudouridine synthase D [Brachybacterium faecium DSM 4810]